MDSQGNLYQLHQNAMKELAEQLKTEGEKLHELTEEQYKTLEPMSKSERKGYMRNQPCPCGSGRKFKKCCW